jgi:hypothetical protein
MGNSIQTHKHRKTHKEIDHVEHNNENIYEKYEIKLDDSFREVPVDCLITADTLYADQDSIEQAEMKITSRNLIHNEEDKLQIDYLFTNQFDTDKSENQLHFINICAKSKSDSSGHQFTRRTSLSTIFEEKSQLSSANTTCFSEKYRVKSYNDVHMINTLLDDFHDKTQVINEIMDVFEPSSKFGAFRRNIPIRLSSKLKYERLMKSTSSLVFTPPSRHHQSLSSTNSLNSKFSPISYNRASERPSVDNDFLLSCIQKEPIIYREPKANKNIYTMIAENRRVRFLRRLRKHIENIRGSKANCIQILDTNNNNNNNNNNNDYKFYGKKNIQFALNESNFYNLQTGNHSDMHVYDDSKKLKKKELFVQTSQSKDKLSSLHIIYENNDGDQKLFSSKFLVKTDVNPVYF